MTHSKMIKEYIEQTVALKYFLETQALDQACEDARKIYTKACEAVLKNFPELNVKEDKKDEQ